eukprot:TRINITY_DN1781_c0_g2_i1.p1 TRINITY_DN1781_c0_g2~~TRINITY_DN1781_c0_g2_i1.p1  ORF type:complete len:330 (+),score=118.94 TRINITY_DN1781_c0_g2_i1:72-1061(+)
MDENQRNTLSLTSSADYIMSRNSAMSGTNNNNIPYGQITTTLPGLPPQTGDYNDIFSSLFMQGDGEQALPMIDSNLIDMQATNTLDETWAQRPLPEIFPQDMMMNGGIPDLPPLSPASPTSTPPQPVNTYYDISSSYIPTSTTSSPFSNNTIPQPAFSPIMTTDMTNISSTPTTTYIPMMSNDMTPSSTYTPMLPSSTTTTTTTTRYKKRKTDNILPSPAVLSPYGEEGHALDSEEKEKMRLAKNREAASQFRQRQRDQLAAKEKEAAELLAYNQNASQQIEYFSRSNQSMQHQVNFLRNFLTYAISTSAISQPQSSTPPPSPPVPVVD